MTDEKTEENKQMSAIDKANAAAERLEAANKRHEELLAREESLKVERILGGRSDAVQIQAQEESAADYAKRVMRGG